MGCGMIKWGKIKRNPQTHRVTPKRALAAIGADAAFRAI